MNRENSEKAGSMLHDGIVDCHSQDNKRKLNAERQILKCVHRASCYTPYLNEMFVISIVLHALHKLILRLMRFHSLD